MIRMLCSAIVAVAAVMLVLVANAQATIVIDGKYNPAEGYDHIYALSFGLTGPVQTVPGGTLATYQDPVTHNLFVTFVIPKTIDDNTWGTNGIGWGSHTHTLSNELTGSDKANFVFKNAANNTVLNIDQDYVSLTGGVYASLGLNGDGDLNSGSAANVLDFATSMDYNAALAGFSSYTTNSPATNSSYAPNPSIPNWNFDITYELEIAGAAFANGVGTVNVLSAHLSPNKLGNNLVTITTVVEQNEAPVPEPLTCLLFGGSVLGGLAAWRRRRN